MAGSRPSRPCADVESGRLPDMIMLIGRLRDTAADDCKVLLAVKTGRVGVDEGGLAGPEVTMADDAGCHC
jgi:hypothetical protein